MPDVETAAAPPKSTATAKDKQCAACREAVVSTVKRLQPMLTQGTKLAVTLALENPCDQQHLQSGSFNPPTLARACAEWLNESGDTLEEVLLEAADTVRGLPKEQRQLDVHGLVQEACFIRDHVCQGADLHAKGASEYLVNPHEGSPEQARRVAHPNVAIDVIHCQSLSPIYMSSRDRLMHVPFSSPAVLGAALRVPCGAAPAPRDPQGQGKGKKRQKEGAPPTNRRHQFHIVYDSRSVFSTRRTSRGRTVATRTTPKVRGRTRARRTWGG